MDITEILLFSFIVSVLESFEGKKFHFKPFVVKLSSIDD